MQRVRLHTFVSRLCVIVAVCFMIPEDSYSQVDNTLVPKVNVPTSPEAAMLGKFGDIPIGYYTGTASVSVPLYTIQEGNLKIPITLNYHGSGIKVADDATWVGLGWDLSPGGAIVQEVRGKKDDEDNNLHKDAYPEFYAAFKGRLGPIETGAFFSALQTGDCLKQDCIPGRHDDRRCGTINDDPETILNDLQQGMGQPDVYHYNFNGYSGKFYINPETKQIVMMDKKDMIYFEKNGAGWKATTLDGTVYFFDDIETTHGAKVTDISGVTTKLSRIELLNGKSITFTYVDEQTVREIYRENLVFDDLSTGKGAYIRDYASGNKKTLVSITTSDALINFNLEDRDDIVYTNYKTKRLKSIDVKSIATNQKVRTFEFSYSYFPYNLTGAPRDNTGAIEPFTASHLDEYGKRLKLDALKEVGYDDYEQPVRSKPAYTFEYNTNTTMPLKNSWAVDFWGYYNAQENDGLIPDLRYFDYVHDTRYLDASPIVLPYEGANRYSNNAVVDANMLKKIYYPTGGYTEFEYEPNTFTNQFVPDISQAELAHKSIHVSDNNDGGNTLHTTFQLSKTVTISFQNSIVGYNVNSTSWNYQDMQGCYIRFSKSKMVNGSPVVSLIKQWDLSSEPNADFAISYRADFNKDILVEYDPDPSVSYLVDVYMPDNLNYPTNYYHSSGVNAWLSYYDDTGINTAISNTCGVRIKSVKNYTSQGNVASNKAIKYYDGKLLDGFEPLQSILMVNSKCNGVDVLPIFRKKTWISSGDIAGGGEIEVGYGKVEEIELTNNGLDNNGKNVYYYYNQENLRRKGYPSSPFIKNGLLTKMEVFDNSAQKLLEKEFSYTNLMPFSCYSGIVITNHSFGDTDWPDLLNRNVNLYVGSFLYKFSYGIYPLISEWNKLQSVVTKEYAGNNFIAKSESYTYNNEGSVSTVITSSSKGELLMSKFYYPQDYQIDYNTDHYMELVHNTGTPVITEQYNGLNLLTRQKTVYSTAGSAPTKLPKYIYFQRGSNNEELHFTIDSYDEKGNITQYTQQNNIPVSIVWNEDKTLAIAKIENATYSSLLALPNGLNSDFRTLLPAARVTTYTYKPLIGVATITDVNNRKLSYQYDEYGRLMLIKDQDGNIVKTFDYHFRQ
jgi:YD repeat-containing protein